MKPNTCARTSSHEQAKIHITPSEAESWKVQGGNALNAIQTDRGLIGVLICYDAEFPELARRLTEQGIHTLFVPFCTDERQGFLRVRYCCQARAVENQIYVALAGNVGNLPNVANMDIQYAQSCILMPCDFDPSRAMGLLRRPRRMSRVSPSQTCDPRRWRLRAPVVRCGICGTGGRIFTRCNGGAINRIFGLMQRIVKAAGTDSDGVILFALLPNDALLLQHGQAHRPLVVARPPVVPGFCAAPRRKSPAS